MVGGSCIIILTTTLIHSYQQLLWVVMCFYLYFFIFELYAIMIAFIMDCLYVNYVRKNRYLTTRSCSGYLYRMFVVFLLYPCTQPFRVLFETKETTCNVCNEARQDNLKLPKFQYLPFYFVSRKSDFRIFLFSCWHYH